MTNIIINMLIIREEIIEIAALGKYKYNFQYGFQNRVISDGWETVPSHAENSCIASYYRQFYTNIIIENHKINTVKSLVLLAWAYGPSRQTKLVIIL